MYIDVLETTERKRKAISLLYKTILIDCNDVLEMYRKLMGSLSVLEKVETSENREYKNLDSIQICNVKTWTKQKTGFPNFYKIPTKKINRHEMVRIAGQVGTNPYGTEKS